MFKKLTYRCLTMFSVVTLASLQVPVSAQQIFTDSGAFDSAAGLVVVEDFESSALGELSAGSNDIGRFDIFLDSVDTDGTTRIVDTGLVDGSREFQGDLDNGHNQLLRFDFDQAVFGFGADFNAALTGDLLTLEINNSVFLLSDILGGNGTGFFGIISDESFDSVTFGRENPTDSGKFFSIDNVRFSGVPEPGSCLILGSLALVVGSRRRR